EPLDRVGEPERTDQIRELTEGAERFGRGRAVEDRGEQVGLADAEAAVEVEAGAVDLLFLTEQALLRGGLVDLGDLSGELLGLAHRGGLAGFVRVGDVGGEADLVEHGWRHHLGDELIRRNLRMAIDEAFLHGRSLMTWCDLSSCSVSTMRSSSQD